MAIMTGKNHILDVDVADIFTTAKKFQQSQFL
jgi:hypothetical protein